MQTVKPRAHTILAGEKDRVDDRLENRQRTTASIAADAPQGRPFTIHAQRHREGMKDLLVAGVSTTNSPLKQISIGYKSSWCANF